MKPRIKPILRPFLIAILFCFGIGVGTTHVSANGSLNVDYHTKEEIRAFAAMNPAPLKQLVTYEVDPVLQHPFEIGKLSQETINSGINMLNQLRYIAGIPANVVHNESLGKSAQAASLINAINNVSTHYPKRPEGVSDELYRMAYNGASSSNIAQAYQYLNHVMVNKWMDDSSNANFYDVGHRRWILNPALKRTGYGVVILDSQRPISTFSMNVSDNHSTASSYSQVAWPAENMPIDYWNNPDYGVYENKRPWSISMGKTVDVSKVHVSLTRVSDNKTWNFSQGSDNFSVNNAPYGQEGCIIFRPTGVIYASGDKFNVVITGVEAEPISYSVDFFDLVEKKPITGMNINMKSSEMCEGTTKTLVAGLIPSDTTENKNIRWSSNNTSVAKVDSYGKVTAVREGNATITAKSSNDLTVTCNIMVYKANAKEIILDQSELKLNIKERAKLTATALPAELELPYVMWHTSDPRVVRVYSDGSIRAMSAGRATITAESEYRWGSNTSGIFATCEIEVIDPNAKKPITGIEMSKQTLDMYEMTSETLTAEVIPSNTDDSKDILWSSSNPSVASVDESGKVTAHTRGKATITAKSSNGLTKTCTVNVNTIVITHLAINQSNLKLNVKERSQLTITATASPLEATELMSFYWSSSDYSVVRVYSDGSLRAVGPGTATITVYPKNALGKTGLGFSATCEIVVQ